MFYDLKLQNIDNSTMFLYQIYDVIHKALFHIATLVKTHDCTAMIWSIAQALQNRPLFAIPYAKFDMFQLAFSKFLVSTYCVQGNLMLVGRPIKA